VIRTWSPLAARAALLGVSLLAAVYALLAYIPWTYQAFLTLHMVAWLPPFLHGQPWLLLGALAANAQADGLFRRGTLDTTGRRGLYLLLAAGALGLGIHPVLTRLGNDAASLAWSFVFLAVPLALAGLDLVAFRAKAGACGPGAAEGRRLLVAAGGSTLFLAFLFGGVAILKARLAPGFSSVPLGRALLWSLPAHLVVLCLAAVGILALEALGGLFRRAGGILLLWLAAGTFLAASLFRAVVFPALSFSGGPALAVSGALGACLAASGLAMAMRLPSEAKMPPSFLDLWLEPVRRLVSGAFWRGALWFLALAGLVALVTLRVAAFDWNFLFQTLTAALAWILAFAGAYALAPRGGTHRGWDNALFLATLGAVVLFRIADLAFRLGTGAPLEPYYGYDASARLLRTALEAPEPQGISIYQLLQRNSNIAKDIRTDPVDVKLVPKLVPTTGTRPDIFILVVDSLRQDYVGAYNPAVTFTPNMDRFASESTVFRHAFTRYGGTGLSEPSIWVGGMMLHKQYVTPFYPMNSLQKLVDADGYQPLIAQDNVLDAILKPEPRTVPLVKGTGTEDLRMCAIVEDLDRQLDQRAAGAPPVFAYAQCQDIHISVINREGRSVPDGGSYPGFYAPYASRVRLLDRCFGTFIQHLKDRGLYDRSIVILCADHGDSLGEQGRFGHAYTLFPEILRVPLIVHLPEAMRSQVVAEPDRPAFLTDITPSLYALLGQGPLAQDPVLGRPLFARTRSELDSPRPDHYLLASSYGPVFGILDGNGKGLYISDGVNLRDHYFDLAWDPKGTRNALTPALKAKYDALILKDIGHLNAFYHFRNGAP
jgi:hypothetical protein